MTRIVTMVVIPHLEPDILQTGDGIPVELFQILKDDAVKVLHSECQRIWTTAVATGQEKVNFHSNP